MSRNTKKLKYFSYKRDRVNPNEIEVKKMEAYKEAVIKVLSIYVKKSNAMTKKEEKLLYVTGLFDYLSTAPVKQLLNTPAFAEFRNTLLNNIHQLSNDPYIRARRHQEYNRLFAVMNELFTYLVQDDSVPRRRSERQKERVVRAFNARFELCSTPESVSIAAELKKWSAVKPEANIKMMPRRSARLF